MAEHIEREEAMFRLSKWLEKASDTNNRGLYNFGEIAAYQTSIVEINSIPAADVRPVVYGTWERHADIDENGNVWVKWICSECGYVRSKGWEDTLEGRKPMAHFCEMCSAIME